MQVIVGNRKSGKTTKMLELMRANPEFVMVILDGRLSDRLRVENRDINPDRFLTVGQIKAGMLQGRHVKILLEDLDQHLHYIVGNNPVYAVSITED